MERHAPRGGGNRLESSPQRGEEAKEDAKLLRHYGTKVVSEIKDDRTIRRKDDKSKTEIVAISRHSEGNNNFIPKNLLLSNQEDLVGLAFQPNSEKSIQSSPSPEFLNSLSFIKKFYPTPRWGEGKFIKVTHENSSNLRHSERQRTLKGILPRTARYSPTMQVRNPANINTNKSKGEINMNNSTETAHASMPLSIFSSKSVFRKTNLGGVGTPPYVAIHLAAWLPSRIAAKRVAFTLAEVLIALGIIGVVAALTLPSVVANYKEKQLTTAWKKAYSDVANAALLMSQNNEDLSTEQKVGKAFAKYLKVDKVCNANKGVEQGCWRENTKIYSKGGGYIYSDPTDTGGGAVCMILTSGTLFCIDYGGKVSPLYFDINGYLKPNTRGKDIFYALFNKENYMVKSAKGYFQNWGPADCDWVPCTFGDGTCEGDNLGYACSAEKLLK